MSIHPRLVTCGLLLTASFGIVTSAEAACTGPKPLEDQLHAHPSADNYARLGTWFGDQRQYAPVPSNHFHAALKLEPSSPRILYLLGLSLYTAGDMNGAINALEQSIQIFPDELKPHLLLAGAPFVQLGRNDEAEAQWESSASTPILTRRSLSSTDSACKSLLAEG